MGGQAGWIALCLNTSWLRQSVDIDAPAAIRHSHLEKQPCNYHYGHVKMYKNIPPEIIQHYDAILTSLGYDVIQNTDPYYQYGGSHLRWMLSQINEIEDVEKANRWLGFIQGILIYSSLTTVDKERDFTRGRFYKRNNTINNAD